MPFSPKRSLKSEELLRDERFLLMPRRLRLLLLSLLLYVDQHGRATASSPVLRETLFEFDEDVSASVVDEMLLALEECGWLLLYESGRRLYLQITPPAWTDFVTIDRRDASMHPAPDPGPLATQAARWADAGPPAAEGKGEAGGRGEAGEPPAGADWMSDPEMPPPAGCSRHPHNTGLISCGPCAGARKIHHDFITGAITHAEAVAAWTDNTRRPKEDT